MSTSVHICTVAPESRKTLQIPLRWWRKLTVLAEAEGRTLIGQAIQLWREALAQRRHIKRFAKEHTKKDETKG